MLYGKERIEALGEDIIANAESQAAEIINNAEIQAQELIINAREKYQRDEESQVAHDKHETDVTYSKAISQKDFLAQKTVLAHRNQKVNELFECAYKKLEEYSFTNEYVIHLKKLLERANSRIRFYSGCIVYCAQKDEEVVSSISAMNTVCDTNIRLGGITVYYPQERLYIDLTFDSALEKQRKDFTSHAELSL